MDGLESERSVLGSILQDYLRVVILCAEHGLEGDAFVDPRNALIYRACARIVSQGDPIDSMILAGQLKKKGQLDDAGGASYIDELIDSTPTASHAEYYIIEMKKKWMSRTIEAENRRAIESVRNGDDPEIIIADHMQKLSELSVSKRVNTKESIWDDVMKQSENASNGIMPGLLSPWPMFNRATGGAPRGLVTVVAGRGGTRKSFLVNQWALHAGVESPDRLPGVYFPLEDGPRVAMRRAACLMANTSASRMMRGRLSREELNEVDAQAKKLLRSGLEFAGGRGMRVEDIALTVARGVAKHGWQFVVIDAFKDLRGGSKDIGMGEVYKSGQLCDMADRHDIPVLVVHHIRKTAGENDGYGSKEDQFISLLDIKGRGEITDDARMVVILQCEKYRKEDKSPGLRNFRLDCQKNNHGKQGKVDLELIDEDIGRFTERAR